MKPIVLTLTFALAISLTSCKKEEVASAEALALITFTSDKPALYSDNTIRFTPQAQFSGSGRAVTIEYQLLDGSTIVSSGKAEANQNPDGLGLFYQSVQQKLPVDVALFKGKTLTVFLDPSHKVTLKEYREESNLHWKKASVTIP